MQLSTAIVEYVSHTRRSRMLLPHAPHRKNDVQRTYNLQHSHINHNAKPSRPNRIKSISASEAATQASVSVSTEIKVKSESNSVPPAGQQHERRYHGVNRVTCAVCHNLRLAFQRCWVPAVAFVQQRDHADAGAGAERTTITCYQSVNSAITTNLCC